VAVENDLAFVGQLLDTYAECACRMGVAAEDEEDEEDGGVPLSMQAGEVNEDGWVEWHVLPSTLKEPDVGALEREFGVQLPPIFRAYLMSRFHLFEQVVSRRYNQQIFMTYTPALKPLSPLRDLLNAWRPLIDAGFIPFAHWGDCWGPMCFDALSRARNDDCPVIWMDHEPLISLGPESSRQRELVLPFVQPLYKSCEELLVDVFG
jgi:hypothetical protein